MFPHQSLVLIFTRLSFFFYLGNRIFLDVKIPAQPIARASKSYPHMHSYLLILFTLFLRLISRSVS